MRLVILILFLATQSCPGETFPRWDVYWMSAYADAIVIGDHFEGDTVKVIRWIKASDDAPPDSIEIAGISKHSKSVNAFWSSLGERSPAPLASRHFIAFLERKEGGWQSMATIEEAGLCGSCGMIWIQDERCYWYAQASNPGPYDLQELTGGPKTEPELLREIDVGLKDAAAWNKALKLEDPFRRAEALVAYTLTSASPTSPRKTFLFHAREPLGQLGEAAVPALRNQIGKWRGGDSLNEVVLILYDIGQAAHTAVPDLVVLLEQPERAQPCYVIAALRATGNQASVKNIKPFLTHPNEQVRREATEAVAALTNTKGSKQMRTSLPGSMPAP